MLALAATSLFRPAQPLLAQSASAHERGPNRFFFGQDIFVPAGHSVHNAVCVFCSLDAEGDLTGRAVVLFGNATIAGRVDGSVVVIGGNAVADAAARIEGKTAVVAGNAVYETEDSLSGDALVLGGHVSSLGSTRTRSNRRLSVSPAAASGLALLGLLLLTPLWLPRRRSSGPRTAL